MPVPPCRSPVLIALVAFFVSVDSLQAQLREAETVNNASTVLDEVMRIPARGVPRSLLSKAQGLVIIPDMVKGGFVVGIRRGRGVVLARDKDGDWELPHFVTMTGGSVGFQAGLQSSDIILVFMTKKSVDGLLRGKFTIGADAAAAAGPVGRNLAAATDGRFKAEILSYSRSRGLFAGVSLDGSSIRPDRDAEHAFYGPPRREGVARIPSAALSLVEKVAEYSGSIASESNEEDEGSTPRDPAAVRKQLAEAALALSEGLNDAWREYLALPVEVFQSDEHPSIDSLMRTVRRFDRVAGDSKFRLVADRDEFKKTRALLRRYIEALTAKPAPPEQELPAPPKD